MINEMAAIVNLDPCDNDLPILYRIFEIPLLLVERNLDCAKEKLNYLETIYDKMNTEQQYYYIFYVGSYYSFCDNYEEALIYFEKALDIMKHNKDFPKNEAKNEVERLYYSLVLCYTELEYPNRAMMFLRKILETNPEGETTVASLGIDIMTAINFYKNGEYDEAEELLDDCLLRADSLDNDFFVGLVFKNLGNIHRLQEKWEIALEFYDRALNIFIENTAYHNWALYSKILCMTGLRKFSAIERMIKQLKSSAKENDSLLILLETAMHIAHLNRNVTHYNKNAVDYIKNYSIPFFIKNNQRLEAINCYKLLDYHFFRTSGREKSLEANREIIKLYERMFRL
jgi:tetratricopeptide (TPR) repeat protein